MESVMASYGYELSTDKSATGKKKKKKKKSATGMVWESEIISDSQTMPVADLSVESSYEKSFIWWK